MTEHEQAVLAVARAHGTLVAAQWGSYSRSKVVTLRHQADGYRRGRGHPTVAELAAMPPRETCDCPRCDEWRAQKAERRARIAATMADLVGTDEEWRLSAACLGEPAEVFFPERGGSNAEAKAICARCPVTEPCLNFALTTQGSGHEHGIFGGTSGRERKRMRRSDVA